jgi:ABC-type Mn2+/Zn2+ transport system ATPase subunit
MGIIPRRIREDTAVRTLREPSARTSGTSEPSADSPAATLSSVWVSYGSIVALRDVTVSFPRGTTTAIIGPNGSGKSTLLGVLSGLVRPSRGDVEVLGVPPAQDPRRVAHVLQTTIANSAVPLTVRETVRMGVYGRRGTFGRITADDRHAIDDAIERMRIGDLVDRQLHELSGGQRQRVYVAQGLAQRADLLLLDEPITGLDLVTQETIGAMIDAERAAGRTVVLTTHDVGTASRADVAVLVATRIVAAGPPHDALAPDALAEAYGGHVHLLDDGTLVLDEPHHHDHRYEDQLGG